MASNKYKHITRRSPMLTKYIQRQRGFTIIELLIATTVFSVVLLVVMSAIVQMGRLYYKSNTMSRTQEMTRSILDDVTRAIQYSPAQVVTHRPASPADSEVTGLCIGGRRFSMALGRQLNKDVPGERSLISDQVSGTCVSAQRISGGAVLTPTSKELLVDKMRIVKMDVQPAFNGNNSAYRVTVRMIYGDNDLICDTNIAGSCSGTAGDLTAAQIQTTASSQASLAGDTAVRASTLQCKNIRSGSEFCAMAELSTIVERRLE